MSAHFHVELGPFTIDVQLDDSGIHMKRGPLTQSIPWDKISGAALIRSIADRDDQDKDELQAAQFLGAAAAQKVRELRDKVGEISLAYRDDHNCLREIEVPAPLTDSAFLKEFEQRLGPRWLGESKDRQQVAKRLHTNPGFFKTILVLGALFGVVAVIAAILLFASLGPLLNLLSIQKMLLDLQDGNLAGFGSRFATYLALFAIGYFLHRVIRSRLDSLKGRVANTVKKSQ
jgi:hypothetical protein